MSPTETVCGRQVANFAQFLLRTNDDPGVPLDPEGRGGSGAEGVRLGGGRAKRAFRCVTLLRFQSLPPMPPRACVR